MGRRHFSSGSVRESGSSHSRDPSLNAYSEFIERFWNIIGNKQLSVSV